MKITLKRRLAAFAAAFLLVFTSAVTAIGFKTDKAHALSEDFYGDRCIRSTYYFSDSEPTYKDVVAKDTFFDIHPGISVAEFEFLVYGGYFLGFGYDCPRAIVIIQLATIKPSEQTLNDLFYCLDYQHCYYMFITPFYNKYESICDNVIKCNYDAYDSFLRQCVDTMYNAKENVLDPAETEDRSDPFPDNYLNNDDSDNGSIPSDPDPDLRPPHDNNSIPYNTVLFLDGRILGIDGYSENLDIKVNYMYSSAFRRLLGYMRYGYDFYDYYNACEEGIYDDLWKIFTYLPLFDNCGCSPERGRIDTIINAWDALRECEESYLLQNFWHAYFWYVFDGKYEDVYGEFYDSYLSIIGKRYDREYADYFNERNIHIFAHAGSDKYYSLFEYDYNDSGELCVCKDYAFIDYEDFLSYEEFKPIDYIYAIAIYYMKHNLHSFLNGFQKFISNNGEDAVNMGVNSKGPTVFLWVEDPIYYDPDGLRVIFDFTLSSYYGQGYDDGEDDYYYDAWVNDFLEKYNVIANAYKSTPLWGDVYE